MLTFLVSYLKNMVKYFKIILNIVELQFKGLAAKKSSTFKHTRSDCKCIFERLTHFKNPINDEQHREKVLLPCGNIEILFNIQHQLCNNNLYFSNYNYTLGLYYNLLQIISVFSVLTGGFLKHKLCPIIFLIFIIKK